MRSFTLSILLAVSACSSTPATVRVDKAELMVANVWIEATLLNGGDGTEALGAIADAVNALGVRVRTGDLKPTAETKWLQLVLGTQDAGQRADVGTIRIPINLVMSNASTRPRFELLDQADMVMPGTSSGRDWSNLAQGCADPDIAISLDRFCSKIAAAS